MKCPNCGMDPSQTTGQCSCPRIIFPAITMPMVTHVGQCECAALRAQLAEAEVRIKELEEAPLNLPGAVEVKKRLADAEHEMIRACLEVKDLREKVAQAEEDAIRLADALKNLIFKAPEASKAGYLEAQIRAALDGHDRRRT